MVKINIEMATKLLSNTFSSVVFNNAYTGNVLKLIKMNIEDDENKHRNST